MKSFENIFIEYKPRFTLFADSYVHNSQLAEDIVTDAFMAYWEKYRNNPPQNLNIPAYILTIVKNKCLNELEHGKVKMKFQNAVLTDAQWELEMQINFLRECNPEEIFTSEMEAQVRKSLAKLTPKARQIFTMSRIEQKTYREIAEKMNLSVKAVEYHMNIALKTLHADLAGYFAFLVFFL